MLRYRLFPLLIILVPLFLCNPVGAQQWSGLLTSARGVDWSGAGAGAIAPRTTVCTTLGTAGQSSSYAQSVTASQIMSALQSCPAGQTVLLNPGTYTMTQTIFGAGVATPSNVTLRGSGPSQTILKWTSTSNNCSGLGPTAFCIYNGDAGVIQYSTNAVNWTGGYSQGATSLTMGSAVTGSLSNLKVGTLLQLNQQDTTNDNGNWWNCGVQPNGSVPGCTWGGNSNGWPGRAETQTVTVTGISGSTVKISPGLYAPNWSGSLNPYAAFSSILPVTGFGVENLQINTQALGDIQGQLAMMWASNSWIKNVSFINNEVAGGAARKHVQCFACSHVTVRDSYFYGSSPSSEGYGVDLMMGTSDTLVENNIFQHIATGTILENGIGNVFGYNYAVDNFYTGSGGAPNWQQCDGFHHNEGDAYDLWEGQEGSCIANDDMHGTSFGITVFRSYLSGHDPATTCPPGHSNCGTANKLQFTAPIVDMAFARYENVVASVLGTAGYHNQYQNVGAQVGSGSCPSVPWTIIYSLNYSDQNQVAFEPGNGCYPPPPTLDNDPFTSATLMRWGNYDVVHGSVQTNSGETASNAPVYPGLASPSTSWSNYLSFYLSSKPSWWNFPSGNSSTPWPAVGPDVTGGNIPNVGGHAWHNPAANCYLNVLGGKTDGSSGPLSFEANACYPTVASAGGPPPPSNLTSTVQ